MKARFVRAGDDRAMPFEHDVHAVRGGEFASRARSRSCCTASMLMLEQPRHLTRMRRDDHVDAVAADEPIRIAGERVQRIGVEHQRHARALEQPVHERRGAGRLAETGTDRDDVGLEIEHPIERRIIDRPGRRFLERLGHVLRRHRGNRSAHTSAAWRS